MGNKLQSIFSLSFTRYNNNSHWIIIMPNIFLNFTAFVLLRSNEKLGMIDGGRRKNQPDSWWNGGFQMSRIYSVVYFSQCKNTVETSPPPKNNYKNIKTSSPWLHLGSERFYHFLHAKKKKKSKQHCLLRLVRNQSLC